MPDFIARFADFTGGDFGVTDPAFAQSNQFTGDNVTIYESGLVGPRPGLKSFPVTGLPNHSISPGPAGFDAWGSNLVIGLDDHLYRIPIPDDGSTPAAVEHTAYGEACAAGMRFAIAEQNLYVTNDGNLYRHDNGTTNTTAITLPGTVELDGLTRWNYRLIGWDRLVPWRLYYSTVDVAGAQWDTWGVNNFIDIPGHEPITALVPWYNALLIGRKSGWTQLSGVVDDTPYVRELDMGNGPIDAQATCRTTDNRAFYWGVEPVPIWFNGESTYQADNYRVTGLDTTFPCQTVIASPSGRKLFMLGEPTGAAGSDGTRMLMNRDRRWSIHSFNEGIGGLAPSDIRHGNDLPDSVIFGVIAPTATGQAVEIVSFDHTVYRPGNTADNWVAPRDTDDLDLVTGSFATPAWYDSQSRMASPRFIVIQFRKWSSGVDDDINMMKVKVRPLGRYGAGTLETDPYLWSEPAKRSTINGVDDSFRIACGDQGWANGFQIVIEGMRGVAIRSIEVHTNLKSAQL